MFISHMIGGLCKGLGITQKLQCAYHPPAAGVALLAMRSTPERITKLSSHEIVFDRPMNIAGHMSTAPLPVTDDLLLCYCTKLTETLRYLNSQVLQALPAAATPPPHDLQTGDWVWVTLPPAQVEGPTPGHPHHLNSSRVKD